MFEPSHSPGIEEKIQEAIQRGAFSTAADLIVIYSRDLLQPGKINELKEFLRVIPEEEYAKNPRLILVSANTDYLSGELQHALRILYTAIPLLKEKCDTGGLAAAYRYLSYVYQDMGNNKKAIEVSRLGLGYLSPDDFRGRAGLLSTIAGSYWRLLDYKKASSFYKKVMEIYIAVGDKEGEMRTLANSSAIEMALGNFQKASREKEEVLRFYQNSENKRSLCLAELNLGALYSQMRELDRAESLLTAAIFRAKELGLNLALGPAMVNLGEVLSMEKKFDQAESILQQALKETEKNQTLPYYTNACIALSRLYRFKNNFDLSHKFAVKALDSCPKESPIEQANVRFNLGQVFLSIQRYNEAIRLFKRALKFYEKMGMDYHRAICYLEISNAELKIKNKKYALKNFTKGLSICKKNNYDFLFSPSFASNYHHLLGELSPKSFGIYIKKLHLKYEPLSGPYVESKPEIKLLTLGGLRVFVNGVEIKRWRRNSARLILCLLLGKQISYRGGMFNFEENFIPADSLMFALWQDKPQQLAAVNLQVAINELRKIFEPGLKEGKKSKFVQYESQSYRLNLKEISLDLQEFLNYYSQARQYEVSKRLKLALSYYQKALNLYKGDFLRGIDLIDIIGLRDELSRIYVDMLIACAWINFNYKNFDLCINLCKTALEKDKWSEKCHSLLMECYARMGRKDLALKQYEILKQSLEEDLGLQPGREIDELKNKILAE
jgi:tetratricopeptide (TPR) repeat protein